MKDLARNGFIGEYQIPHRICDDMLHWFEAVPITPMDFDEIESDVHITKGDARQHPAKSGIEITMTPEFFERPHAMPAATLGWCKAPTDYYHELSQCINKYMFAMTEGLNNDPRYATELYKTKAILGIEGMVVQRYSPGQGYLGWHNERSSYNMVRMTRELVFMTYLNDCPDGGTFFHPDKKYEAKKGLTLVWPAGFTHMHKGEISHEHTKYIATGWYGFDTNQLSAKQVRT